MSLSACCSESDHITDCWSTVGVTASHQPDNEYWQAASRTTCPHSGVWSQNRYSIKTALISVTLAVSLIPLAPLYDHLYLGGFCGSIDVWEKTRYVQI